MVDSIVGAAVDVAVAGAAAVVSAFNLKKLQKASLRVVAGEAETKELKFAYNPTEFSTSKSAKWNRPTTASAVSATEPQFGGTEPQRVVMDIFFDAWEDQGDVSQSVLTLFEWVKPTKASRDKHAPNPPVLAFQWGSSKVLADFKGFLSSVNAKYTLFRADGVPLRATASITLEEIPTAEGFQNPTSRSPNSRRSHVVGDGDSLHSIAYRELGEPGLWRALAAFNDIDDPLRIRPGLRILIPSVTEAAALAAVSSDG